MTVDLARRALLAALLLVPLTAPADPVPEPPLDAQAAHQVPQEAGLRQRLLGDDGLTVRLLDPAIFLEVSPVTATEPAVRLPDDQQDHE
jgi:hypothetical protein